ncbi:hypothetical protein M1349_04410 [Patescibacteria group bacterium]|nr:hypothetical protein [Patescibacteria group bacterium]
MKVLWAIRTLVGCAFGFRAQKRKVIIVHTPEEAHQAFAQIAQEIVDRLRAQGADIPDKLQ